MRAYNVPQLETLTQITIWPDANLSRRKAIQDCSEAINSFGKLLYYDRESDEISKFSIEISPLKINLLVKSLEYRGFRNEKFPQEVNKDIPYLKPGNSLDILLCFE